MIHVFTSCWLMANRAGCKSPSVFLAIRYDDTRQSALYSLGKPAKIGFLNQKRPAKGIAKPPFTLFSYLTVAFHAALH